MIQNLKQRSSDMQLKGVSCKVKRLGFEFIRLPQINPADCRSVDMEQVKRMVDQFMENGFTYFDTAVSWHGGQSEAALREALVERYPRSSYTITDKLSLFMIRDKKEIPVFFERQMKRLGVDYVDYYWLYGMDEEIYRRAEEMDAFAFVKKKKAEGKVKHIGLSFHDRAELLEEILAKHPEMEYVQLHLDYLEWEDPNAESRKCYETACRHRKPVIVMEPVKDGSLEDIPNEAQELFRSCNPERSIASWAVRFAATPANVMMVLPRMSDEAQMADDISYMRKFCRLDEREKETVRKAADIIRHNVVEEDKMYE